MDIGPAHQPYGNKPYNQNNNRRRRGNDSDVYKYLSWYKGPQGNAPVLAPSVSKKYRSRFPQQITLKTSPWEMGESLTSYQALVYEEAQATFNKQEGKPSLQTRSHLLSVLCPFSGKTSLPFKVTSSYQPFRTPVKHTNRAQGQAEVDLTLRREPDNMVDDTTMQVEDQDHLLPITPTLEVDSKAPDTNDNTGQVMVIEDQNPSAEYAENRYLNTQLISGSQFLFDKEFEHLLRSWFTFRKQSYLLWSDFVEHVMSFRTQVEADEDFIKDVTSIIRSSDSNLYQWIYHFSALDNVREEQQFTMASNSLMAVMARQLTRQEKTMLNNVLERVPTSIRDYQTAAEQLRQTHHFSLLPKFRPAKNNFKMKSKAVDSKNTIRREKNNAFTNHSNSRAKPISTEPQRPKYDFKNKNQSTNSRNQNRQPRAQPLN